MKKKLFIISSEKISSLDGKNFFCDNIDMQSTPEKLTEFFDVDVISKKTNKKKSMKINLNSINISGNIINYLIEVIKTTKNPNTKYLIISISPYTFLACLILRILGKKPFVYLRSNGFEEYKVILGTLGYIIYFLMFSITSKISSLISCRKHILKGNDGHIVNPSQLDIEWKKNLITPQTIETKLLYVGRIRKEKGIFALIKILEKKSDIKLTIVGQEKEINRDIKNKNIDALTIINDKKNLIKIYDQHNIFILPSFTEGHPMVLLEALSRLRHVIIFKEIEHVIGNFKGIFVAERNIESLVEKTNFIKKNYEKIQKEMTANKLPSNKEFITSLRDIMIN